MMYVEDCICGLFEPLALSTQVALVLHRRETKKPTNTGRLAELALEGTRRLVRGHQDEPADVSVLVTPERRAWLLFPREDAAVVSRAEVEADPRPITLVVPDGTWPQARRCVRREPVLSSMPCVLPPPGPPTRYRLRREHVEGGLATFEAIARVLGVIEGAEVQSRLEAWFDAMVERMLARRPPGRLAP